MVSRQLLPESLEPRFLLAADLAVSFAGRIPATYPATGIHRVTVQLTNHGDAIASGPATIQLYASSDTTIGNSAFLLGSAQIVPKLKVGASTRTAVSFSSPTNLNAGTYYLVAAVIPGFVEDNVDNDIAASRPVHLTPPFVDLTDTVAMTPVGGTYTVGAKQLKAIKFSLTIHNAGTIVTRGPLAISLFGSADTILDNQDQLLQSFGVKQLRVSPGKSAKFSFSWVPNSAVPSGSYFGILQLNTNEGMQESNFANNSAVTSSKFTIVNTGLLPRVL